MVLFIKKKIGIWHTLNTKKLIKTRNQRITEIQKNHFIKNLYKLGYAKNLNKKNIKYSNLLTSAFQRRFRQELINGIIDEECLIISKNLVKKFK